MNTPKSSSSDYVIADDIKLHLNHGDAEFSQTFEDVFKTFRLPEQGVDAPDIIITDSLSADEGASLQFKGGKTMHGAAFSQLKNGPLTIGIGSASGSTEILLKAKNYRATNPVTAFLKRTVIGKPSAILQRLFSYNALWSLLHIALLKRDHAFIHASAVVSPGGASHLIVGVGGAGKTSCTLNMVTQHQCKYQAEDFAIINSAGQSFLSPRPLSIYESDIKWGNAALKRYKAALPLAERLMWNFAICMGRNPLRRVAPREIFSNDQIHQGPAKIKNAFFILRHSSKDLDVKDISNDEFIERCMSVSMREIVPAFELLLQRQSCMGGQDNPLTLEETLRKTKAVYTAALGGVKCTLISAPYDMSPDNITAVISEAVKA